MDEGLIRSEEPGLYTGQMKSAMAIYHQSSSQSTHELAHTEHKQDNTYEANQEAMVRLGTELLSSHQSPV